MENLTNITLESVCVPSEDLVAREIEDEIIIIPLVSGMAEFDDLFTCNETGRAIWKKLDGKRSIRDIIGSLLEDFEADEKLVTDEVLSFISELVKRNMVVVL